MIGPNDEDMISLCDGFDGVYDLGFNDGLLSLFMTSEQYLDKSISAGIYTFTITGTSQGGIQKTTTFEWLFVDPCGPPEFIAIGEITPPAGPYIVTDPLPAPLDLPTFTISPSYC